MKAAEWIADETLSVSDRVEPHAGHGQAVVEVAACGICGSDLHSFRHGFAIQPGQVLGHEFAGTVVEAPGVSGLAPGARVVVRPLIPCGECPGCRSGAPQRCADPAAPNIGYRSPGAFAERVLVPRAIVGETVFALPDEVSDRAGALVEPLAVSLHAVERAAPQPDDSVLVLGAGMIGLGVIRLLRLRGIGHAAVAELSPLRRERALALGADRVIDPDSESIGDSADVVIDCAGAEAGLREALRCLRPGGTLVLAAIFGRRAAANLDRIVEKELEVRGSFGYRHEFPAVVDLFAAGQLDPKLFVTHEFELGEIGEAFRTQSDPGRSIKVLVVPGGNAIEMGGPDDRA